MSTASRNYLQKIDSKSFEECVRFINEQSAELGVQVSGSATNVGSVLHAWATYLSAESEDAIGIFTEAVAIMNNTNPKDVYKNISNLNNKLQGKAGFWEKLTGSKNELVSAITSHPFYKIYQEESLAAGFVYVKAAYDEFEKIDAKMSKIKSQLDGIKTKLTSLNQPTFGLNDIALPGDLADNLAVAASLEETKKLLEQKQDLFYSPTATGNLANAAAIEMYSIWQQSKFVLDLAMSRWLIIAYFGLMLNTVIKHQVSGQVFAHMVEASNAQLKEFGSLVANVAVKQIDAPK